MLTRPSQTRPGRPRGALGSCLVAHASRSRHIYTATSLVVSITLTFGLASVRQMILSPGATTTAHHSRPTACGAATDSQTKHNRHHNAPSRRQPHPQHAAREHPTNRPDRAHPLQHTNAAHTRALPWPPHTPLAAPVPNQECPRRWSCWRSPSDSNRGAASTACCRAAQEASSQKQ